MKGIILKDWYVLKASFRSYLFLYIVFIVVSCFGSISGFFVYYPCIIASMLPVSLLSYEEKEKWHVYEETFPCTRSQIVSAKYIISLIINLTGIVVISAAQAALMLHNGTFSLPGILTVVTILTTMSFLPVALLLPPSFKFGTEKGRLLYMIVLGVFFALLGIYSGYTSSVRSASSAEPMSGIILLLAVCIALAVYLFSWRLSIHFYQKREIS